MIKKYLVTVQTNWCGEDNTYSAIVDDDKFTEFETYCNNLAYENFQDYGGFEAMMEDLFDYDPDREEWSDEELREGYAEEPNYYSYTIEEFDEDGEEEWEWYNLVWDDSKEE